MSDHEQFDNDLRFYTHPGDMNVTYPDKGEPPEDELSEDDAEDDTERDRSDSGLRMSDDAESLIPKEFGAKLGKLLKKKRLS